jgi:hypothetical protein
MDAAMSDVNRAIQASQRILSFADDWDGEGSPAYERETLDRAVKFVATVAREYYGLARRAVPAPRIMPGPDGSIDVAWRTAKRELLINIPADKAKRPDFYGDTGNRGGAETIKGTLDLTSSNLWLLIWLTK